MTIFTNKQRTQFMQEGPAANETEVSGRDSKEAHGHVVHGTPVDCGRSFCVSTCKYNQEILDQHILLLHNLLSTKQDKIKGKCAALGLVSGEALGLVSGEALGVVSEEATKVVSEETLGVVSQVFKVQKSFNIG